MCRHSLDDLTLDTYQLCYDSGLNSYYNNTIHILGNCPDYANKEVWLLKFSYYTSIKYIYAGTTDYIGYQTIKKLKLNPIIDEHSYFPFSLIYYEKPDSLRTFAQVAPPTRAMSGDLLRIIGYEVLLSDCKNIVSNGIDVCNSYVHADGLYFLRDEVITTPVKKLTIDNVGRFESDVMVSSAGVYGFAIVDMEYKPILDLGGVEIKTVFNSIEITDPSYEPKTGIKCTINFTGMSTPVTYRGYVANDSSGHIILLNLSDGMNITFPNALCTGGTNKIRIGLLDIINPTDFFESTTMVDVPTFPVTITSVPSGAAIEVDGTSIKIGRITVNTVGNNIISGILEEHKIRRK